MLTRPGGLPAGAQCPRLCAVELGLVAGFCNCRDEQAELLMRCIVVMQSQTRCTLFPPDGNAPAATKVYACTQPRSPK